MNSTSSDNSEPNCAFCLDTLPQKSESKVCKKCLDKHNPQSKYGSYPLRKEIDQLTKETSFKTNATESEHYCNLCKNLFFSTGTELSEHLIEHSFRGCEERGYNCYICSAIFTLPSGLHQHMIDHGPNYRPYDCNLCEKKFYFRAELENHHIDHETGRVERQQTKTPLDECNLNAMNGFKQLLLKHEHNQMRDINDDSDSDKEKNPETNIKLEAQQYSDEKNAEDDDDEYIEVEQLAENTSVDEEANNENKPQSPRIENDD